MTAPEPSALSALPDLAQRINEHHRAAEADARSALQHALEAGRLLVEAKKSQCQHGQWVAWLADHFDGSERTAQAYMRVSRHWPELEAKAQTSALLTVDAALASLGRTVDSDRRTARVLAAKTMCEALEGRRFALIYADPPWRYEHPISDSRKIENQYETMDVEQIAALPVSDHCIDNAALFMWATNPKLAEAIGVLEGWGFSYRTNAVWVKHAIGMGYYFRQRHELLLVGTRGSLPSPEGSNRPDSVIEANRGKHSEKPLGVYDLLDQMYPEYVGDAYRVELFARQKRKDWFAWGNEVDSGEVAA